NNAVCSQTVTVVDTTPPSINCGSNENPQCGLSWDFTVPILSDNCSSPGQITLTILSTTTNLTCPGTFVATRIWQATDACSNSSTCTQIVSQVDSTAPVPTCASDKTVECGSLWDFDAPTALDGCTGTNVTITVLTTVTNSAVCPLQITRTWTIADPCNNST